jgi:uroporphyrinogen-III decarboxylase
MNSKERVKRTIEFRKPDRVPYAGTNSLLAALSSDVFPIAPFPNNEWQPKDSPPNYPHIDRRLIKFGIYRWDTSKWNPSPPKNWYKIPHTEIDEWGCYWDHRGDATMGHPSRPAINSWEELDSLQVPDGSNRKIFNIIKRLSKLFPRRYQLGLLGNFLFERTHFIRGFTRIIIDYKKNPDMVKELVNRIKLYYLEMMKNFYLCGCDGVMTPDDLGTQISPMISPNFFNKFYKDAYKEVIELCHKLDMHFILHSCGNIGDLMPILIDIGVDAFQFDSPHMVGLDTAAKYAGKVCFWDTVNIQSIYPFGNTRDVFKEVIKMIKAVGAKDGGLLIIDYFGAPKVMNVPKTNVKAMWEAVRVYGRYKENGESILI